MQTIKITKQTKRVLEASLLSYFYKLNLLTEEEIQSIKHNLEIGDYSLDITSTLSDECSKEEG